eukprot:13491237-Heterocapsa_arctica.AAC.1
MDITVSICSETYRGALWPRCPSRLPQRGLYGGRGTGYFSWEGSPPEHLLLDHLDPPGDKH